MLLNAYRQSLPAAAVTAMALLLAVVPAALPGVQAATAPSATVELLGGMIAGFYQGSGVNGSTAILMLHETSDFINALPCTQLNQRGYAALCGKSQYTNQGEVNWDSLAQDVGAGVKFLRSQPGIQHVVLVGWSGGGAIMSYYQNVAENGVSACNDSAKLDPCSSNLAGLPKADGVILLDAIPGLAFSNLSAWDPSVNRSDGLTSHLNPDLYLFNPANGYNTDQTQSSTYTPTFIDRYTLAQADREADLVNQAEKLQQQIASGEGDLTDDMLFPTAHDAARIWQQDTSLIAHTKGQYLLITPTSPNGAVQQINSVRTPAASVVASSPQADDSWAGSGKPFTVNTFMSTSAISAPDYQLTADSIDGVDWSSSNTATVSNVAGISAPMLMMSMTAHYWVVPTEMYYQAAEKSTDKTLAYVYGAIHTFTPCTVCGIPASQIGDTVTETFNYAASWLASRF